MEGAEVSKVCPWKVSMVSGVTVYWTVTLGPAGNTRVVLAEVPALAGLICWGEPDNSQQTQKKMYNVTA